MGAMINILPIYARPFWREQGLNGLGSGDLPFLELTADSGPPEGQPAVLAGFVIPGTWTGPARLAAANHGRVIWAGSEVSPRWPGYFEGAIETGELAAATALGELTAN